MNILVAPNAFKHSLGAEEAAAAIKKGFIQSRLECRCECFPVGDGGDGTGGLIIKRLGGKKVESEAHDPLGREITSSFGLVEEGKIAIIEMANASGLRLLKNEELDPLHANSFGTGEQIKTALDKGVRKIIIAMGGSATVDGGCGMLKALGVQFLDKNGSELDGLPASLEQLASVDLSSLDKRIAGSEIIVLCDVDNRLLGDKGAAAVFGPQKGASVEDVQQLDKALQRLSAIASQVTGKDMTAIKYGGTAGGAAAGLYAFLNAKLVNGIEYFLQLTRFEDALKSADIVITGEGSIDDQTLQGKGPFGVAKMAKEKNLPVIGLAGKVPLEENTALKKYFDTLLSINDQEVELEQALANTEHNLMRTAEQIGNRLANNYESFLRSN